MEVLFSLLRPVSFSAYDLPVSRMLRFLHSARVVAAKNADMHHAVVRRNVVYVLPNSLYDLTQPSRVDRGPKNHMPSPEVST